MALDFVVQVSQQVAQQGPIEGIITLLENFGFFKIILPFLLVFAIIYAVLARTKVLGDPKTNPTARTSSTIVALVAGFLVIRYTAVVEAFQTILPQAGFLIVVVVLMLIVLGLFGLEFTDLRGRPPVWLYGVAAIIAVIFIAMVGFAVGPDIPILHSFSQFLLGGGNGIGGGIDPETLSLAVGAIVILGIVGGVIFLVTKKD